MTAKKLLGSLTILGVLLTSLACKPTPEVACKAAADAFDRCAKSPSDKWGDTQMQKCVTDVRAAGYEKSVKKCSEMKDCETARTCLMIMLVGASKK